MGVRCRLRIVVVWLAICCCVASELLAADGPIATSEVQSIKLSVNPGAYIWYAQPLDDAKRKLEIFYAYVLIDASQGRFGFHLEPRFRDSKLRDFFASNVWLQEAYAYGHISDDIRLKIGKLYSRFGMFWDGTFANLQYFDGLKLSPDNGFSFEGTQRFGNSDSKQGLSWALQYFPIDGSTNGSLTGRDTLSIAGARKVDAFVARLSPELSLPQNIGLLFGLSMQRYRADFVDVPDSAVQRIAVDATITVSHWARLLGEYTRQRGHSVSAQADTAHPVAAAAPFDSGRSEYGLANIELKWKEVTARGALSMAHYADTAVRETFLHPGLSYAFDPRISLVGEWIHWTRHDAMGTRTISNGLHLILFVRY